jgi:hypothetical protein
MLRSLEGYALNDVKHLAQFIPLSLAADNRQYVFFNRLGKTLKLKPR